MATRELLLQAGFTNEELDAMDAQKKQLSAAGFSQEEIDAQPSISEPKGFRQKVFDPAVQAVGLQGPIGSTVAEKTRTLASGLQEEGARFAGETVGEVVGSKFGRRGAIAGAGIGRAAGDAFQQIAQQISNSPNAPLSTKESAARLGLQFAQGAGSEAVAQGIVGAGARLTSPFFNRGEKSVMPDFEQVKLLAKEAGIGLTAAQRTSSRGLDNFESFIDRSIVGSGRLKDIKQIAQPAGIRKVTKGALDSVLAPEQQVGRGELAELVTDAIGESQELFKTTGRELFSNVDKLTRPNTQTKKVFIDVPSMVLDATGKPVITQQQKEVVEEVGGALVDMTPLKQFAQGIMEKRAKEGGTTKPIDAVLADIMERPNRANFETAQSIRSDFLEVIRSAPSNKDRVVGVSKKASSLLDSQMGIAAEELSPQALREWRGANAFWKSGKEDFNKNVVRRVIAEAEKGAPEKVVDIVFSKKSPEQVRQIFRLVDPLTQDRLKRSFLEDAFAKASAQIPGDVTDERTLIGKSFIDQFDKMGDGMMEAVFGKKEAKRLRDIGRLAKTTQGKVGGVGDVLAQVIQLGPVAAGAGGLVAGQKEVAAKGLKVGAAISGFTELSSLILTNPKLSKILTDTAKFRPGTEKALSGILRLSREVGREVDKRNKIESMREKGQAREQAKVDARAKQEAARKKRAQATFEEFKRSRAN